MDVSSINCFDAFQQEVEEILATHFKGNKLTALINNASIGIYKPFVETTEEELGTMTNIHFKGPYFLTQKLLPFLHDESSIVNISSGLARFSFAGYSA